MVYGNGSGFGLGMKIEFKQTYNRMEILNVNAVSFISWPHKKKRLRSNSVASLGRPYPLSLPQFKGSSSNKNELMGSVSVSRGRGRGRGRAIGGEQAIGIGMGMAIGDPTGRFDLEGGVNEVAAFLDRYPFFAFGVSVVVFIVIPLLSDQLDKSKKWTTAEDAYNKLRDEVDAQLLDIRSIDEISDVGSPHISSFNKTVIQVTCTGDDNAFLAEMLSRFKEPAKTSLYILDMYCGKSMQVAQMLTRNGFKEAYAIRDGFQGTNGWQAIEERLFTNTTKVGTRSSATVSPDQKVYVTSSSVVNKESPQYERTESSSIPSSAAPDVGTISASRHAPVISDQKIDVSTPATEYASDPSYLDRKVEINLKSQGEPVEVSSEAICFPREISPYPQYPDLKPPTPSKPTTKTVDAATNDGAAMSDQKIDVFAMDVSCFSQPLSPYTWYPDLKPPTSPMPSKTIIKSIDAATKNCPVISNKNVDVSTLTTESALLSSSRRPPIEPATEAPFFSHPLSPYTQYPDSKPPMSSTPLKPTVKIMDAATNNDQVTSDQNVDVSASTTESALHLSSCQQPPIELATETPCFSWSLSPYTQYPDLKPPTSPTPSRP